jgi:hypothetical protein
MMKTNSTATVVPQPIVTSKKDETDGGTTPHEKHNEVLQIITSDKRTNKHQQK